VKYNKLVRDRIPDIITRRGDEPVTQILDASAYKRELRSKLQEEVAEFGASGEVEELADVLEVVYALAATEGVSQFQLEEKRKRKRRERGGFDRRILLIEMISTGAEQQRDAVSGFTKCDPPQSPHLDHPRDGSSRLKVVVGSTNPVKIAATTAVLCRIYDGGLDVWAMAVESGVSYQPWGNERTMRGALNRAQAARRLSGTTLGVGFEGGLLEVQGQVFTCAWCAVVRDDGVTGIAGGENVLLPPSVVVDVQAGAELGPAMDTLTGLHNTKQGGGAIGVLTEGQLDRQAAYEHLLTMALARLLTPAYYET